MMPAGLAGDVVLFVGPDFLLTVHRTPVPLLEPLGAAKQELRPDQVLYRLVDTFVESYIPIGKGHRTIGR
jgi:Mg2+ and Co2+ transporter CorA